MRLTGSALREAVASEVSDEECRKLAHLAAVASSDLRVDAVHVHLAIANRVEPCPGQGCFAFLETLWDGHVVRVEAVDTVGFGIGALESIGVCTLWAGVSANAKPTGD